jgi:hypothetical protein
MGETDNPLLSLAASKFAELTQCEMTVLDGARHGRVTDCENGQVRASLIRWLCVTRSLDQHVDTKGLRVHAASVQGYLDLDSSKLCFPLSLTNCAMSDGIDLRDAETRRLDLSGSECGPISAAGITIRGSLILNGCLLTSTAKQVPALDLRTADINGDLSCIGAHIRSAAGPAILADGLVLGGSAYLREGFWARGEVGLFGATIGGNFDCHLGRFYNRRGTALYASKAKFGANVFFRKRFRALGTVRLHGASITGNLECTEGCFIDPKGTALLGDGLKVGGRAFFGGGFCAKGCISLDGATILTALDCSGGLFSNRGGDALRAERLHVSGSAHISGNYCAIGAIVLRGATIEGDFDLSSASLINVDDVALFADEITVGGSVRFGSNFQAFGQVALGAASIKRNLVFEGASVCGPVSLLGATINGNLRCSSSRLLNRRTAGRRGTALLGDELTVDGKTVFNDGSRIFGEVRLYAAKLSGHLRVVDSAILNCGETVLCLDQATLGAGATIGADVTRRTRFRTNGLMTLVGSTITGSLSLRKITFIGIGDNGLIADNASVSGRLDWLGVATTLRTVLRLSHASVGQFYDDAGSWPSPGNLHLDGFKYTSIAGESVAADARLRWLKLQPAHPFHGQPYEQLASTLRNSGQEALARSVGVEKQDMRRRYAGLTYRSRVGSWILKATIGHGYRPHWALGWSAAFVVLGWFVFHLGYEHGLIVPTKERVVISVAYKPPGQLPRSYASFNALVFSLDNFLPIVNLRQKDNWQPNDAGRCVLLSEVRQCGWYLQVYIWLQILFGWVLTSLWVAGLSGLIRKD